MARSRRAASRAARERRARGSGRPWCSGGCAGIGQQHSLQQLSVIRQLSVGTGRHSPNEADAGRKASHGHVRSRARRQSRRWSYQRVARILRASGHDVYAPTLTGLGERAHLLTPGVALDTHITDGVQLLCYEGLFDAILVGHSYGGMVISGVADRALGRLVPGRGHSGERVVPRRTGTGVDGRVPGHGTGCRRGGARQLSRGRAHAPLQVDRSGRHRLACAEDHAAPVEVLRPAAAAPQRGGGTGASAVPDRMHVDAAVPRSGGPSTGARGRAVVGHRHRSRSDGERAAGRRRVPGTGGGCHGAGMAAARQPAHRIS
ncbi:alpha/beta fold hydrolase [Streptomyces sp. NPDC051665]|uniref:alpha/beta fold hydrolase n=1 Tax=Streptomyces sp. NPDC051665 TaxID=3154647 RepID=UPI0034265183